MTLEVCCCGSESAMYPRRLDDDAGRNFDRVLHVRASVGGGPGVVLVAFVPVLVAGLVRGVSRGVRRDNEIVGECVGRLAAQVDVLAGASLDLSSGS